MVADDPGQPIKLKAFASLIQDHTHLQKEHSGYREIPMVKAVPEKLLLKNYYRVKKDIEEIVQTELEILLNTIG